MLVEHPEICRCGQWIDVEDRRIIEHEVPWGPKNAHQRRQWKKRGKPKCPGSGEFVVGPVTWIERHA